MPTNLAKQGIKFAKKIIFLQSLIAIFLTFIALFISEVAALSAFLGGMAAVLPNVLFAVFAFRYAGASQTKLVYKSFQTGSKLKLILTSVIFLLIYRWPNVQPVLLFGTFVITLLSQWVFSVKTHYLIRGISER